MFDFCDFTSADFDALQARIDSLGKPGETTDRIQALIGWRDALNIAKMNFSQHEAAAELAPFYYEEGSVIEALFDDATLTEDEEDFLAFLHILYGLYMDGRIISVTQTCDRPHNNRDHWQLIIHTDEAGRI